MTDPHPLHSTHLTLHHCYALLFVFASVFGSRGICAEANVLSRGKWTATAALVVGDLDGFQAVKDVQMSRFGGIVDQKLEATGFFSYRTSG